MSSVGPQGGAAQHGADGAPQTSIKEEVEVVVKREPAECALCGARGAQHELGGTRTAATGTPLLAFLQRFTSGALAACSRALCAACLQLVNVLDRAERDYRAVKESFELLLSKSPLFEVESAALAAPPAPLACVKSEQAACQDDSEDEPLARTKRKHGKGVKKKKKTGTTARKRKTSFTDKWECEECGVSGETGGPIALAAHKITEHADHSLNEVIDIKTEDITQDPDRSHSPFNNGTDIGFGDFEEDDDEGDSTFNPDEFLEEPQKKTKSKSTFKRPKTWHPCDICSARYSSLVRLEQHKLKHDGSKPPYICEVCGAHYKHKRACDIHIALHKGISDWKCEECNKLFPSKNALQRHNNIHTGKLNYQCDLCGKSFIHTSSFKMHKLSHSGVKPHACDVCGLALMTRSHLKRHKRIHSGEKRHECGLCGKRFSERYNLAAHAKSHEAAPPPPPGDAAQRRRLFRCHFCTERFERRYMLERHMSVLHGRTLERPPPTPRNTMSKLLKAQAQARHAAPALAEDDSKESGAERAAPPAAPPATPAPSKLLAQLTSQSPSLLPGAWGVAYAELSYAQP